MSASKDSYVSEVLLGQVTKLFETIKGEWHTLNGGEFLFFESPNKRIVSSISQIYTIYLILNQIFGYCKYLDNYSLQSTFKLSCSSTAINSLLIRSILAWNYSAVNNCPNIGNNKIWILPRSAKLAELSYIITVSQPASQRTTRV